MVTEQQHAVDASKEKNNDLVFSYLTLRNLIGFCGMMLPWILALCPTRKGPDFGFEPSISDYFYTDRGDALVVLLSVLGVFLLTYKGYNWKERCLTIISAIGALCVAFIPTTSGCDKCIWSVHTDIGGIFHNHFEGLHITSAALFLSSAGIISLCFFKLTHQKSLRIEGRLTQKGKRNRVYTCCGWIMICSVLILGLHFLIGLFVKNWNGDFPIVFVFETIAVEAFGISWLTKGQTLWPDGEHYVVKFIRSFKNN